MKRLARRRRAPWVVLALGIAALAAAAAVAVAGLQPANLSYTPNSENQVTNIDVARAWIKNYYGSPGAATGKNGAWRTPLNAASNYAAEASSVAKQGGNWLAARSKVSHKAIVLDVDDTTLATWNYELYSNWDYNPTTNFYFVDNEWFPAVPGMVDMVNAAAAEGYAVFFVTGRPTSQYEATLGNLTGSPHTGVTPPVSDVPVPPPLPSAIDAGYSTPTSINLKGTNNPADVMPGLFTKPAVGSYPDYLNKPEFCAAAIAANASCGTIAYKSGTRAYIESQGYDIVGNFGDQFSDLEGGYADKTFKMPNPNYYLP
jgi:HAD superfamily, subfamily IIIB (Acid phosphatase)